MERLSVSLLGGFLVRGASGRGLALATRKAQGLLAYLALRPGETHPRGKLAALLWGDRREARARHSLRQALWGLRRILSAEGACPLLLQGEIVALEASAVEVDVATFERLAADATPEALERAVALYRGDLLAGLDVGEEPFEEWLRAERERLREMLVDALAQLLVHQMRAGRAGAAIQSGVRLLALDPLQEAVHRTLMRLYLRQGRPGAALRQFEACVGVVRRELGLEPEAETRRLYRQIVRGSKSSMRTLSGAASG